MNSLLAGIGLAGLAGALGARKASWSKSAPDSDEERHRVIYNCGKECFLLPGGTISNPGVPAFPVCKKCSARKCSCQKSCSGMRAAFSRGRSTASMLDNRDEHDAADQQRVASNLAVMLGRKHGCGWAFRGKAGEVQ